MARIIYKNREGKRVPGVTTIIGGNLGWNKQVLMWWAWNEGMEGRNYRETSERAANIGTMAHMMVEADLKGMLFSRSALVREHGEESVEKAEVAFRAWLEWKSIMTFELIGSELQLVSDEYGYGGTIDIAGIKNKRAIIDLKTSNGVYPDHLIQIAAYGNVWNENNPDQPIEAYYLLRLGKEDGSFHYHYWPELVGAFGVFKNLLELHEMQKKLKRMV